MTPVTTTDEQKITVGVEPRTAGTMANPDGKPAQVDGDIAWTVTEGDATVEVVEGTNGKQAVLISGSADTVSRIEATADADLGEGMEPIKEEFIYTVTAAGASRMGITVGAAEQK